MQRTAQFPQHIYCTAERPDIVAWSEKSKEIILVELTVGDESNFSDQVARKEARYSRELIPGLLGKGKLGSLRKRLGVEAFGIIPYQLY